MTINPHARGVLFPHRVHPSASGERCHCGEPATHKVEEDIWTTGREDQWPPDARHPWTSYLCCTCFGDVMGPVVQRWCQQPTVSACYPAGSMGDNYCGVHPNEEWPCRHLGA